MMPAISPEFIKFLDKDGKSTIFRDSPEWGAALVLAPWYVYQRYGDKGILEANYAAMKAYMGYLDTRLGDDGLLDFGLGDWYDLGPKNPGPAQLTSRKMTGTATYYAQLIVLEKVARLLGKPDGDGLGARAATLRDTMRARLFDSEKSTFDTGSQTAQAMALVLDLFPPENRQKALDILAADIQSHNDHTTAGDIGFHYVVRALSNGGRSDLLYKMLSRTDKPAYLQQIVNGATSLTEAWDSWRAASQNHFMLGHAEIWFYQGLGGLQIDHSADGPVITLVPQIVAGIDGCDVESETVLGRVRCTVQRDGARRSVRVEIPVGQTARVRLPFAGTDGVTEGGISLDRAKGALVQQSSGTALWLTLESGNYAFIGPA